MKVLENYVKISITVVIIISFFIFPSIYSANSSQNGGDSFHLPPPGFSHPGGFYTSGFELELSVDTSDCIIYYTLDGSVPGVKSKVYEKPLEISEKYIMPEHTPQDIEENVSPEFPISYIVTTPHDARRNFLWRTPQRPILMATVVKAVAYHQDYGYSDIVTNTYYIAHDIKSRYSMPVISISFDIDDFFDYDKGIYVPGRLYYENEYGDDHWGRPYANYHQRGREWERPIFLEYYEPDGTLGFAQKLGARIHGSGSRALPQKSLRIYARNDYDTIHNAIRYDIFGGLKTQGTNEPLERFKRLIIRNNGQLFYDNMIGDMLAQNLVSHTNVSTQAFSPVIVFLNGEYWGLHTIIERIDSRYLESHFDLERNEIVILTGNAELSHGTNKDRQHYLDMLNYIRNNDISSQEHYDYIQTLMDIENFIEYVVFQIFCGNYDWPGNNIDFWRSTNEYDPNAPYYKDGRWRWIVFDMDFSFGVNDRAENSFEHATREGGGSWPNPDWSTFLFRSLLKNESFKQLFLQTLCDNMNTYLSEERALSMADELVELLLPEMREHIDRWTSYPAPTILQWKNKVNNLKNYIDGRTGQIFRQAEDFFGLEESVEITFDISNPRHGNIYINSFKLSNETVGLENYRFPWKGRYFTEYPITLTAAANPGYEFAGWEGISKETEKTIEVYATPDKNYIKAVFVRTDPVLDSMRIATTVIYSIFAVILGVLAFINIRSGKRK